MDFNHQHCQRCGEILTDDRIKWLELDWSTNRYSEHVENRDHSQGWFPFGRRCAELVLADFGHMERVR